MWESSATHHPIPASDHHRVGAKSIGWIPIPFGKKAMSAEEAKSILGLNGTETVEQGWEVISHQSSHLHSFIVTLCMINNNYTGQKIITSHPHNSRTENTIIKTCVRYFSFIPVWCITTDQSYFYFPPKDTSGHTQFLYWNPSEIPETIQ